MTKKPMASSLMIANIWLKKLDPVRPQIKTMTVRQLKNT